MMSRRASSSGFTLVELLIVLVLLSLIVLAMASALRTGIGPGKAFGCGLLSLGRG